MNFLLIATALDKIESTTSRSAHISILADLFRQITDKNDLKIIICLLQGILGPNWKQHDDLHIGEAILIKSLTQFYGYTEKEIKQLLIEKGDIGLVAEELAKKSTNRGANPTTYKLTKSQVLASIAQKYFEEILGFQMGHPDNSNEYHYALTEELREIFTKLQGGWQYR